MSSSSGRICSILAGWLQASCYLVCHGLVCEFDFAPAFEGHSDEITDLDYTMLSRVVDGTRKEKEAKREQWFTAKVWVNESIPTQIGPWAVPCDSRRLSTHKILLKDVFADWNSLALKWLVILSRPSSWLRRPPTSTTYSGCDRWEFTLVDGECDCWLVLTCSVAVRTEVAWVGHRATPDVRRTTDEQALRGALLAGVQLDVTMLSEHQDLADAYSGCVTGRVWASKTTVAPVTGQFRQQGCT